MAPTATDSSPDPNAWFDIPGASASSPSLFAGAQPRKTSWRSQMGDPGLAKRSALLIQRHTVTESDLLALLESSGPSGYQLELQIAWWELRNQLAGAILGCLQWWTTPTEFLALLHGALEVSWKRRGGVLVRSFWGGGEGQFLAHPCPAHASSGPRGTRSEFALCPVLCLGWPCPRGVDQGRLRCRTVRAGCAPATSSPVLTCMCVCLGGGGCLRLS
jgi:hypothetical protein